MKKMKQKNPANLENLMKIKVQTITAIILFVGCALSVNAQTYTLSDKNREICNCSPYQAIDVLTGDTDIACASSAVALTIIGGSKVGAAATINPNNTIAYTPPSTFSGSDNLQYSVLCNGSPFTGTVYITVSIDDVFVDDIWYFGGYKPNPSDYNTPDPNATSPGIIFKKNSSGIYEPQDASGISKVNTMENSLSISSPYCNGQSIFYVNYNQLYNNQHQPMLNGAIQGHWSNADGFAVCYMGDNKYLLFSVTADYVYSTTRGLNAYTIDMNLDNGAGSITAILTIEGGTTNMSESIELIARAGTSNQYWIIYRYAAELRCRLADVSDPGSPTVSSTYTNIGCSNNYTYQLKVSHQKNKLAMIYPTANILDVYDFDHTAGTFSNKRTVNTEIISGYSVEFSPSGSYVYVTYYYSTPARLSQYDLSPASPTLIEGGTVTYWEQTSYSDKGGGLKLGPDGKIYVAQAYSKYLGVINDPDSATSLTLRYNIHGFEMSKVAGDYLEFSTGITKPAIPPCNTNHAPIANLDTGVMCNTSSGSSVTVNVLLNDIDPDPGNTIYLTDAQFMNSADEAYASLTLNAGSITLTIKSGASVPMGHIFNIQYSIKDNGIPASMCATGLLKIYTQPVSVSISASANDVCASTPVTFTATPDISGIGTFQWVKNTVDIPDANASTYTYPPANGDVITGRILTSTCAVSVSGSVTMNITAKRTPSIIITAVPD